MKRDGKSDVLSVIAMGVTLLILLTGYVVGYFGLSKPKYMHSNALPANSSPVGQTRVYPYQWQSVAFYPMAGLETLVTGLDTEVTYDAEWKSR